MTKKTAAVGRVIPARPNAAQVPGDHPLVANIIKSISENPAYYLSMARDVCSDAAGFAIYGCVARYAGSSARELEERGVRAGEIALSVAADTGAVVGLIAGEIVRHYGDGGAVEDAGIPTNARKSIDHAASFVGGELSEARFAGEEPERVARSQIVDEFVKSALRTYDGGKSRILGPVEKALEAASLASIVDWPAVNKSGNPAPNALANVRHYLERRRLVVGYDRFLGRKWVEQRRLSGGTVREQLDDRAVSRLWGDMQLAGIQISKAFFHDSMTALVETNITNSALEFVNGSELGWDGTSRIDTLFPEYFGVEDTELHRAWSRAFMLTMVRRVRQPGSELFGFPILEAPVGGEGKSSAAKALVPSEWFTDSMPLGATPKEVQELGRGKLLVELSELRGMSQVADFEAIKAMLTRTVDSARAAYGREAEDIGRMFSFIGTTNMQQYLRDGGGLRRFWPMTVIKPINVKALARDRNQLWAEAAVLERTAETTNVPDTLFALEREVRKSRILHKKSVEELLPMLEEINFGVIPSREIQAALQDIGLGALFASQAQELGAMMRALGFDNSKRLKRKGKLTSVWIKGDVQRVWLKYDDGGFVREKAGPDLDVLPGGLDSAGIPPSVDLSEIAAFRKNGKRPADIQLL